MNTLLMIGVKTCVVTMEINIQVNQEASNSCTSRAGYSTNLS